MLGYGTEMMKSIDVNRKLSRSLHQSNSSQPIKSGLTDKKYIKYAHLKNDKRNEKYSQIIKNESELKSKIVIGLTFIGVICLIYFLYMNIEDFITEAVRYSYL